MFEERLNVAMHTQRDIRILNPVSPQSIAQGRSKQRTSDLHYYAGVRARLACGIDRQRILLAWSLIYPSA